MDQSGLTPWMLVGEDRCFKLGRDLGMVVLHCSPQGALEGGNSGPVGLFYTSGVLSHVLLDGI